MVNHFYIQNLLIFLINNCFFFLNLDERFEYARKLKLCMSALRSAGERMGRYALAKRQAVVQEDFITAKLRKEQIEMYKNAVFAHLRVEALMERDKVKIIDIRFRCVNIKTQAIKISGQSRK